jgi:hypothetical protein
VKPHFAGKLAHSKLRGSAVYAVIKLTVLEARRVFFAARVRD